MPSQAASAASTTDVPVVGLSHETVWLDKRKYEDAERQYHEQQQQQKNTGRGETATGGPSGDAAPTGRPAVNRKQSKKQQQQQQQSQRQQSEKTSTDTNTEKETSPKVLPQQQQQQQSGNKKRASKKSGGGGGGGDAKEGASSSKAASKKTADKPTQPSADVAAAGCETSNTGSLLVDEISRAKQHIKNSLQSPAIVSQAASELNRKIAELEAETNRLNGVTDNLRALVLKLENRISTLEKNRSKDGSGPSVVAAAAESCNKKVENTDADNDDVDLFGSEEEDDEEKERLHQERLKAYEAKKSKKPALIAKSNIVLDIKPWDDETDMKEMEKQVRTIVMDGLIWGASKLVPLAYGIHKLQISCVVEDDKVSVDLLQEQIEGFEELVQSVDIAAFNKV